MDSDRVFAAMLAARHVGGVTDVRVLGEGSNNINWLCDGARGRVVVKLAKPHREAGALEEYTKEAWCSAQARDRSVLTPEVFAYGKVEDRAFALLEFIDGRPPSPEQAVTVWHALGEMARRIHAIEPDGRGPRFEHPGRFAQSWDAHLAYNITNLSADDQLIARNVLTSNISARLQKEFIELRAKSLCFGLCHGDIAPWNTLIDADRRVWLLDWGCAAVHVVPHYEFNEIARTARPDHAQRAEFLKGYGLSPEAYDAMTPDLRILDALREIDTLRWAIENAPDAASEMTLRARTAVRHLNHPPA